MTPPFFQHLFGQATIPRDDFLREGKSYGIAFVMPYTQMLFDELQNLGKMLDTLERVMPEALRPVAGDVSYLRTLLAMHEEIQQALKAGQEPPYSFEAYLNAMYDFWPRFRRLGSHMAAVTQRQKPK